MNNTQQRWVNVLTFDGLEVRTFATHKAARRELNFIDYNRHEIEKARVVSYGDRYAIEIVND